MIALRYVLRSSPLWVIILLNTSQILLDPEQAGQFSLDLSFGLVFLLLLYFAGSLWVLFKYW